MKEYTIMEIRDGELISREEYFETKEAACRVLAGRMERLQDRTFAIYERTVSQWKLTKTKMTKTMTGWEVE